MKKVLIILGHPRAESFNKALADAYAKGARRAGAEVKRINLRDLKFDPVLREGYAKIQKLEKDLIMAQEAVKWADHIVIIYPTWWASMPSLLKGFIDRVFLPGFAFKYEKNSFKWHKFLEGKSACLITTMDVPAIYHRLIIGSPGLKTLKKGVLKFSGVGPVKSVIIDLVRFKSKKKLKKDIRKIEKLGEKEGR